MPGVLRHDPTAGDSIAKTVFNDESYHQIGGVADKVVMTAVLATAAEFTSDDPVLDSGEMGVEQDTGRAKIGNGSSVWSLLPYTTGNPAPGYEVFTSAEKAKLGALADPYPDSFTWTAGCYLFAPADSDDYFWGSLQSRLPKTDPLFFKMHNPHTSAVWIRAVTIGLIVDTTLGSAELSSLYIRVNNTTDYLVTDQINCSAELSTYKNSGLDIELGADDFFEFKWTTPAWVTNPTDVQFSATIKADTGGSSSPTMAVSTLTATSVGDTIATVNGNLTGMGGESSIDVSIEWGLTDAYGNETTPETKTSGGTFYANLTSLPTTTLHHFRAKAVGSVLTVYGSDFTFTTGTSEDPVSLYGTMAYTGSDPIGGGAGYTSIITAGSPDDADHTITTADTIATFLVKLAAATTGEVIYVQPNVNLNFYAATKVSGVNYNIAIPDGVILASNRGYGGSAGGRLYTTSTTTAYPQVFFKPGNGCRITGLRLEGPDQTTSNTNKWLGIGMTSKYGLEVDNCEIFGFSYGGIGLYGDGAAGVGGADFATVDWDKAASIHHSYIHHCRASGLGYGIQVGSGSQADMGASAFIEACHFNACRHFISGERNGLWTPSCDTGGSLVYKSDGEEVYIKAHYCVFGYGASPECTGTQFDFHGGSDTCLDGYGNLPSYLGRADVFAGGEVEIKWCDFLVLGQGILSIRGIPRFSVELTWCWNKSCNESQQYTYIKQRLFTIPTYSDAPPYVANSGEHILVENNWWGTTPPPES